MTTTRLTLLAASMLVSLFAVSSASAGDFFIAPHYNTPFSPGGIATADLNQDGNSDWVFIAGPQTVTVMLSKGDGTFGTPQNYTVSSLAAASIALADFNGDGKIDIAVCTSGGVGILFGNGDGTFQPVTTIPGARASRLITADVNGDGKVDLITIRPGLIHNPYVMSVLLGKGDGTFQNPVETTLPFLTEFFGGDINSLGVGDFNRDGRLDVAVVIPGTSVIVLFGNGDGTFQDPVAHATEVEPICIAVADVNNDSKLDLIVAYAGGGFGGIPPGNVSIMLGNGDGTFQAATYISAGNLNTVRVADLNADGKPDLITVGANVGVLFGNGDGSFHTPVLYLPTSPLLSVGDSAVAIGDFNHDGKPDLVVGDNNGVSVLFNSGDGTLVSARSYQVGALSMAASDFNGDGQIDLALADGKTGDIHILLGNPDGTFQTPALDLATTGLFGITAGDFNNDGKPDIVGVNFNANTANVYLGNGDGTFRPPIASPAGMEPLFVTVGDLNGDGKLDLVTANQHGGISDHGDVTVLLGDGTGRFASPVHYQAGQEALEPVLFDLNQDGFLDLALAFDLEGVDIFLGKGDGTFGPLKVYACGGLPRYIAVGDLNSDGKPDIVTGDGNLIHVLTNHGDGTFTCGASFATASGSFPIAIGDFDGDGKADVAVGGLDILHGNGDGTFQPPVTYSVAPSSFGPDSILVADLNQDGAPDLALGNSNLGTVSILFNIHGTKANLTGSASVAVVGQPVTFTATIEPTFRTAGTPTGSVSFYDGDVNLGTAPLVGSQAQLTKTFSIVGIHSISALYSGDGLFSRRNITAIRLQILAFFPTNAAVTTSGSPSLAGQSVTFTANVTSPYGNQPTGTIQFNDFGSPIGTANLIGSSATLMTSTLAVGPHLITAAYSGDAIYGRSISLPLPQIVKNLSQADTAVTIHSSANPVLFRGKLILTSTVSSSTGTPDGFVKFMDAENVLADNVLLAGGQASFETNQLTIGRHRLLVVYQGTPSFAAGISPTFLQDRSPRPR